MAVARNAFYARSGGVTAAINASGAGCSAIEKAVAGASGIMVSIERLGDAPYRRQVGEAPLDPVANNECKMPCACIGKDGRSITPQSVDAICCR